MKIEVNVYIHGDAATAARLDRIEASIDETRKELMATVAEIKKLIADGQDVLAQHIATLSADLTAKSAALSQQIADLQAQVAAGQQLNPADFQDLVDANTALVASVDKLDPNTPPPTNPATPTP